MNSKNDAAQKKAEMLVHAFCTNTNIADAIMKVKGDKTKAAINRIYRYKTNPSFSDVELGKEEIIRIADEALTASCKRISYICSQFKKTEGVELIKPVRNEDGSYKKVEDMTRKERIAFFSEYMKIDWLIKAAVDEYSAAN